MKTFPSINNWGQLKAQWFEQLLGGLILFFVSKPLFCLTAKHISNTDVAAGL